MENKSSFQWTGMIMSGIVSVVSADTILRKKSYFLYTGDTIYLGIFSVAGILVPVILLI